MRFSMCNLLHYHHRYEVYGDGDGYCSIAGKCSVSTSTCRYSNKCRLPAVKIKKLKLNNHHGRNYRRQSGVSAFEIGPHLEIITHKE